MRYINVQAALANRGWCAEIVDSPTRRDGSSRPCTYIYAVRDAQREFLCTFSELWRMSRQECAEMVETLEVVQEVSA